MEQIKLCPFLKITKEENGTKTEFFQLCKGENCMMYNYGVCALSNKESLGHY